ncbi:glycerate kinase [Glaciibacter superstes]|uniref:glycerate kinase n=1 Tax=Glaciibacter superstes TaxID=501023 RepID=UPI0003B468C4|nr:glycerate kinase [Glaciibacter superstes]
MRIVIAPDKFKGSLTAPEVARHLEIGLRSVDPDVQVDRVPVADGGEGTLDAALGSGFTRHSARVTGPSGQPLVADFAVRGAKAVIEMAAASGLDRLPGGERDALGATSRGTGELILAALNLGCTHIVLAVGGSATTDGGASLLSVLGAGFFDSDGHELSAGGGALIRLASADLTGLDPRLETTRFTLASDVDNPLLGARGAATVFAPQKGATAADVVILEAGLAAFAAALTRAIGQAADDFSGEPGAGAAGGVGYAALAVLGATRRPGVDVVLEFTDLARRIADADLVITGEGSLDEQSLGGKTPLGVARAAAAASVPVIAVCGRTTLEPGQLHAAGFERTYALTDLEPDVQTCMSNAGALLERIGAQISASISSESIASASPAHASHERVRQ